MAKLDQDYNRLLQNIVDQGRDRGDRTGTGTRSIGDWHFVHDVSEGFPLLTSKKMATKQVITELLWFLSGDTNIQSLVKQGNNIWVGDVYKKFTYYTDEETSIERFIELIKTDDDFANKWGELGPIYGKQWVKWECPPMTPEEVDYPVHINQIQNVIDTLNTNPESRRIMVSAWNVAEISDMVLPPCHWAFGFYTEELTFDERCEIQLSRLDGVYSSEKDIFINSLVDDAKELKMNENNIPHRRLSLKWHQRSVDTFLGLPFNIASYGFLLEMIAQQVNMVPHKLIGDLSNVHIYNNHNDAVTEQLSRDTLKYKSPTLKLNKAKDIFSYKLEDFEIVGYESDPTINAPLSN